MPNIMSPPLPADETGRLAAIASYGLGEPPASMDSLDRVANLTSALFQAPIATVSLVGGEQQCFLGQAGLDVSGIPHQVSFCAHAIAGEWVFTVANAAADDERFACKTMGTDEPKILFYTGAPLIGVQGHHLGTLCVIDHEPRAPLSPNEKALLRDLADLAVSYLDQQQIPTEPTQGAFRWRPSKGRHLC